MSLILLSPMEGSSLSQLATSTEHDPFTSLWSTDVYSLYESWFPTDAKKKKKLHKVTPLEKKQNSKMEFSANYLTSFS